MADCTFSGLPVFETERLKLRTFRIEDADEYFCYHNDPDVIRYYDWKPNNLSEAREDISLIINSYQQLNYLRWAVTFKGSDTVIGDCGLITGDRKAEISYILSRNQWGKGIMTEAQKAIISFCFKETNILRIQALSMPENHSSSKLLNELDFKQEGLLRKYGHNLISNQFNDLIMWSLLREEFSNYSDYTAVYL